MYVDKGRVLEGEENDKIGGLGKPKCYGAWACGTDNGYGGEVWLSYHGGYKMSH